MATEEKPLCNKCGRALVMVTKSLRQSANPLYPISVTKYQCTDESCQADTDKKQAEMTQQRLEREERSTKSRGNISNKTTFPKA